MKHLYTTGSNFARLLAACAAPAVVVAAPPAPPPGVDLSQGERFSLDRHGPVRTDADARAIVLAVARRQRRAAKKAKGAR